MEHFAGDGLMAFFNDPVPDPEHRVEAVRTALEVRERIADLSIGWRRLGYDLALGVGITTGYATLGRIGFEGRYDYAAIGSTVNLAARLSDVAAPGEIPISQRLQAALEDGRDGSRRRAAAEGLPQARRRLPGPVRSRLSSGFAPQPGL